jgi:glutamate/tyrosine decarboxylase-like PLP-dependent enzyme
MHGPSKPGSASCRASQPLAFREPACGDHGSPLTGGSGPAPAALLQFLRLGREGYAKVMRNCSATASHLAKLIDGLEHFRIVRWAAGRSLWVVIVVIGPPLQACCRPVCVAGCRARPVRCRSADQPHALPLVAFSLVKEKSEAHGYDEVGSRRLGSACVVGAG